MSPTSTPQHSPGPWKAPTDRRDRWIRAANSVGVCQLPRPGDLSEQPDRKVEHAFRIAADANLIAVGPAMLAALRELTVCAEAAGWDLGGNAPFLDAARVVIAQAEGRAS